MMSGGFTAIHATDINDMSEDEQIVEIKKALDIITTGGNQYGNRNKATAVIRSLKKPSPKVQLAAIEYKLDAIKHLNNPTKEVQLIAVNEYGLFIQHFNNPDSEIQLAAVKQNPKAFMFVKNPSKELQLIAINADGRMLKYVNKPDEEMKKIAITNTPKMIIYVEDSSNELQKIAVEKDSSVCTFIQNPTNETIELCKAKGVSFAKKTVKKPDYVYDSNWLKKTHELYTITQLDPSFVYVDHDSLCPVNPTSSGFLEELTGNHPPEWASEIYISGLQYPHCFNQEVIEQLKKTNVNLMSDRGDLVVSHYMAALKIMKANNAKYLSITNQSWSDSTKETIKCRIGTEMPDKDKNESYYMKGMDFTSFLKREMGIAGEGANPMKNIFRYNTLSTCGQKEEKGSSLLWMVGKVAAMAIGLKGASLGNANMAILGANANQSLNYMSPNQESSQIPGQNGLASNFDVHGYLTMRMNDDFCDENYSEDMCNGYFENSYLLCKKARTRKGFIFSVEEIEEGLSHFIGKESVCDKNGDCSDKATGKKNSC
jgi:hypothetical protein